MKSRKTRRDSGRKYFHNYSDEIVPEDYQWDNWRDYRDGFREGYNPFTKEKTDRKRYKNSRKERIKQARRNSPRNKR